MSSNQTYGIETPDMSLPEYQAHNAPHPFGGRSLSPNRFSFDDVSGASELPAFVNSQSLPDFVRSFAIGDGSTVLCRDSLRNMLNTLEKTQLIELLCQSVIQSEEVHSMVAYSISSLATFRRLLVRNIAFSSTSEDVKQLLGARYGEIEEGTVVYDRNTGRSKGFAFITFATVEAACTAIIDSNNGFIELSGRQLLLKFAADKVDAVSGTAPKQVESPRSLEHQPIDYSKQMRKLFVYNLSASTTNESLGAIFGQYGPMEECLVVTDAGGVSKRYAFVTFLTEDSAWRCLQEPNKTIDGRMTFSHLASEGPSAQKSRTPVRPMTYRPYNSPQVSTTNEVDTLFHNILSDLMRTPSEVTDVESLWETTPENIKRLI